MARWAKMQDEAEVASHRREAARQGARALLSRAQSVPDDGSVVVLPGSVLGPEEAA
jgi:ribosomal protein L18E